MSNYAYSNMPITNIATGDTITFRDGSVYKFVNNYYNWWVLDKPPSTISANTVKPSNNYVSNIFSGLENVLAYLNSLSNQNGKCKLSILFLNYINGYSHPHTDVTITFETVDYWTLTMSKTFFYEDSSNIHSSLSTELINFAEARMRESYCFKIGSTCCLDYECNPNEYYKL